MRQNNHSILRPLRPFPPLPSVAGDEYARIRRRGRGGAGGGHGRRVLHHPEGHVPRVQAPPGAPHNLKPLLTAASAQDELERSPLWSDTGNSLAPNENPFPLSLRFSFSRKLSSLGHDFLTTQVVLIKLRTSGSRFSSHVLRCRAERV
jgi:hypothetical protein